MLAGLCLRVWLSAAEANALVKSGFGHLLGSAEDSYWAVVAKQGVGRPRGTWTIGCQLYGDEAEIFKDSSYMVLHWMSEQSEHFTDPARSRWLVAVLPKHMYVMSEGVNLSLQALIKHIVDSINLWRDQGVHGGLFASFTSLKGDWKFLQQVMNLSKNPSTDQICFHCNCTKSMEKPLTDMRNDSAWRTEIPTCPWHRPPEILGMTDFTLASAGWDILHVFYIGIGRDIAASALLCLLRTHIFNGRTVAW